MKQHAPAAQRNREPILQRLRQVLPPRGLALELASGTGQHVLYFAQHLHDWTWQPSDIDPTALASIEAHRVEVRPPNVLPPVRLDVSDPDWGIEAAEAIVCINMIHIAAWACCEGLMAGAQRLLPSGGVLVMYGPYRFKGRFTAQSNAEFDAMLRMRNPQWGVRDVTHIDQAAAEVGLQREALFNMPANNHILVYRKGEPEQR